MKSQSDMHLADSGERLTASSFDATAVEHLHRYALAEALTSGKDVLDIACGEGYGSNLLAKTASSVTGIDISKEAIEHARSKYRIPNLRFIEGSADCIPVGTASVDLVVSFETLEHHDKHDEMMLEIKRVLKQNGCLLISTPDRFHYSDIPNYKNEYHVKELYLNEFRDLITRYFKNLRLLFQKIIYGSVILPDGDCGQFRFFKGNFTSIRAFPELYTPTYNLCVASDGALPDIGLSVFDGMLALERLKETMERESKDRIKTFLQSRSYRLGRILTWPARKFLRR